jgi:hypothetical protein
MTMKKEAVLVWRCKKHDSESVRPRTLTLIGQGDGPVLQQRKRRLLVHTPVMKISDEN